MFEKEKQPSKKIKIADDVAEGEGKEDPSSSSADEEVKEENDVLQPYQA